MQMRPFLLGTAAYTSVTFVWAVVWHIVFFKDQYQSFGYFTGEPSFILGFVTILMQGAILSWLYPMTMFRDSRGMSGLRFSLVVGLFFWTSHVLAFVAKQEIINAGLFMVMESFYLLIQFAAYGLLIGLIYSRHNTLKAVADEYQ